MTTRSTPTHPRLALAAAATGLTTVLAVSAVSLAGSAVAAGPPDPPLATTAQFAVLAGSGITNTGPTTATGDFGTFPTTSISGPGSITTTGTIRGGDAVVQGAKPDLITAYDNAAGALPPTAVAADIGGRTLVAGVYKQASALQLTGSVTLDGQNDPSSVFIIQVGSDLTTATTSSVNLVNGAQACHVYWQVAGSATFGTGTAFKGNVLALTSISATTGATFEGRLLARNGAVTLDTNTITLPTCTAATTPPPTSSNPVTPTPTKKPTPKPTTKPSKGGDTGDGSRGDRGGDRSSSGGGGSDDSGSGSGSGSSTGTGSGSGSATGATGLPDTGGPPAYLAPLGAATVLAGAGLLVAARRRSSASHRA